MHVFRDLKPYICTFPECSLELVQFSTRAQWADHEFSCHRFVEDWCCPLCSTRHIHDRRDCEQHLEHSHGILHEELAYWVNRARTKRARIMNTEECLLCRTFPTESRQAFIKHCCRHMEEIALMAMPQTRSGCDEDSSDEDTSTLSSGHSNYSSLSDDANHNSRKTGAPAAASMKHNKSTMPKSASIAVSRSSDPWIGDQEPSQIDPTPKLLGGPQIKKKRSRTKVEVATHKCNVCEERFTRAYNLRIHMANNHPDRAYPHPCTAMNGDQQCTKQFQRKTDLDRHYDSEHLEARNHRCGLCGNLFALRDTLIKYRLSTVIACPPCAN